MDRSGKIRIASLAGLGLSIELLAASSYMAGSVTRVYLDASRTLTEAEQIRDGWRDVYEKARSMARSNGAIISAGGQIQIRADSFGTYTSWVDNHGVTHVETNLRSRDAAPRPTEEHRATEVQYNSNGTVTVTGPAYPSWIVPSVGGSSGTVWIDGQGRLHTGSPRPAGSMYHQVQDVYFDAQGNKLDTISHTHVVDGDCNPGRRQQDLVASIHDDGHGQVSFTEVAQTEPATSQGFITPTLTLAPDQTWVVDPQGNRRVYHRDLNGNVVAATEATGPGTRTNAVTPQILPWAPPLPAPTALMTNAKLTFAPATLR